MKEKTSNVLLIVVFIAMITIPQIVFWAINKETSEISATENRKLSSKPELKLETITEYPKQFDDYYNDHLPFRKNLREMWTRINYSIFNTTVDDRVILGKQNWLFYRGDKTIEQLRGIERYSEKEKEQMLNNLSQDVQEAKNRNIEMYILILPNKENVYREYLPESIKIYNNVSGTEEFINYIKENSDINIIYPKEALMKMKEKYQIYRKYDTHWNPIGAFVGVIELQKAIDSSFNYNYDDIKVESIDKKDVHDLAGFANLDYKLYENAIEVKGFYPNIEYTVKTNPKYEEYISNADNDKTVLIVGDSFRGDMRPYFSKLYKKVIYIDRQNYKKEIVNEIKPDIMIIETVERFSKTLKPDYI